MDFQEETIEIIRRLKEELGLSEEEIRRFYEEAPSGFLSQDLYEKLFSQEPSY